jgi:hypothetical protein
MQCQDVRTQLGAFFDGELSEVEKREIQRHLETCQECQTELAAFEQLSQRTREAMESAPDKAYWVSLPQRITDRLPQKNARGFGWRHRLGPANLRFASWIVSLSAVSVILFFVGRDAFRENEVVHQTGTSPDSGEIRIAGKAPVTKEGDGSGAQRIESLTATPHSNMLKDDSGLGKVTESGPDRSESSGHQMERVSGRLALEGAREQQSRLLSKSLLVSQAALPTDSNSLQPRSPATGGTQFIAEMSPREKVDDERRTAENSDAVGQPGEVRGVSSFTYKAGVKKTAFMGEKTAPPSAQLLLAGDVKPATGLPRNGEKASAAPKGEGLRQSLADTISALYRLAKLANSGALESKDALGAFSVLLSGRYGGEATDESDGVAQSATDREIIRAQILEAADLYYRLATIDSLASLRPSALRFYERQEKILCDSLGKDAYRQRLQALLKK